ncbi:7e61a685-1722-43cb-8c23-9ba8d4414e86 [Sclerotinia trifoliorum]|uniref:7e61a685-1722-43cb-8c23-9ba8d4414e86 n=1 Tax=Sclerotinia trifoliorum TaxID=28548 RepID=A0A8H2ZP35_9HELO|nr:7e61a685-1722-43cb-8c23-9ba8d4414e86 [Sclerotinia trifoliorum]
MTVTQIYPSIAPLPITESDLLYHPQHFDPQSQILFQQQQQEQQQQQQQQQQHSYLDPALAQNDLRIFTQGLAHNRSYDTPLAPYPASDSSDGSIDLCGGVMNWVNGRSATMPTDPYIYNQSSPSAPPYALALTPPTQSLSPREPNAKRDASTAASARFRQKKKQREKILESNVKQQQERIGMMECRIKELEGENGFLKELVMGRIKWKEERENEESSREEEEKEKDSRETE